ncbi:lipopolysaccharide heptosyltransferase family protein [Spirosoma sp. HMF4905]|uniref:Lipopolysaccharide heptosyltransferase family protein n=1 Tax=Spirosoma arboris TaxID=2682092 RepID=A0A7K1SEJ4_9BACT|nr:glycosyltransferase family 9 protein [Spirosoma arboris]MVM32222.1 lipopolysaccharide heptosyltransferase family protein [Spirosoma arboris]
MLLKNIIRILKTSPLLIPILGLIDLTLYLIDQLAILTAGSVSRKPNTLLILRIDVLGDYLLFRPYLRAIRQSTKYKDYAITLCANSAIRTVAEVFDHDLIDTFIWTDMYKLSTRPLYRFRFVQKLRQQGFASVFCPTYSRVLVLDDFLAKATGASERVGCLTDFANIKRWEAWFGNQLYTRLLPSGEGLVFELERNRRIVEAFLEEPLLAEQPRFNTAYAKPVLVPGQYTILSLGAGQDFRVWPADRFAEVARYILTTYPDQHIILTGAPSEMSYADAFLKYVPESEQVINLTGKLSIPELIYVLSKADLLIANETGIVHLAASTNTPTIVISQGKSLVRWHPYSPPLHDRIIHLYPEYIEQNRSNLLPIAHKFNPESPFPITIIETDRVVRQLDILLKRGVSSQ